MDEEELEYGKTLVTKTGGVTETTTGVLNHDNIMFDMSESKNSQRVFVFYKCYEIVDVRGTPKFFELGDSGSGVFLCRENRKPNKVIGIGIGIGDENYRESTFVCNIREIIKAFDIVVPTKQD